MLNPEDRAKLQALFLKEIYAKAKRIFSDKTSQNPNYFPIDPQGRVIIDVELSNEDWRKIYKEFYPEKHGKVRNEDLDTFKAELGHPIQQFTSVSLDLQTSAAELANAALTSELEKHLAENKNDILTAYQGLAKGRIISLQQETHFHAHLIGRMLKTAVAKGESEDAKRARAHFGDPDVQFQKGIEAALLKLNERIMELQAKALEKAYSKAFKKGELNHEKFAATLNAELDKARKILLPDIAQTIRTEVIKATGIRFNKNITKYLSKHLAEATSGSANDFVHIDKGTGFISFIGASEHTSHHQELGGNHLADRMMYSHHLQDDENIIPLAHRQQVRVPSIAVKRLHPVTEKLLAQHVKDRKLIPGLDDAKEEVKKIGKGKLSEEEINQIVSEYKQINTLLEKVQGQPYTDDIIKKAFNTLIVNDTVEKLDHLQKKYHLGEGVEEESDLPHAFVYNLYTTLNKDNIPGNIDEKRNKQSQSAEHILEAAHAYNRKHPGQPLCLVQNIPVNGWGHELSIEEGNPDLVNEAALMMQMASLHTVYSTLVENDKEKVKELFDHYTKFLDTNASSFYKYAKENQLLETLQNFKRDMTVPVIPSDERSITVQGVADHRQAFVKNAKVALISLFKNEEFGKHENGFTYQALSVFVENASIGGCKSANERAQAVNGRASILDFVSLDKETRDNLLKKYLSPEEAQRLTLLADTLEESIHEKNVAKITANLDGMYGALNLEGFQAIISFIDQGGHAKLATKGTFPNTNNAETVTTHVKNASKWQCHKGLTQHVLSAFSGIEKISYGKEFKSIAKAVGLASIGGGTAGAAAFGVATVLGVGAAFPPVGIAIGLAIGVAAGVAAIVALSSLIYKVATNKKAEQARFAKIEAENNDLVDTESEKIKKQPKAVAEIRVEPQVEAVQEPDNTKSERLVGEWRLTRSASAPDLRANRNTFLPRSSSVDDMRDQLMDGRKSQEVKERTSSLSMNPSGEE